MKKCIFAKRIASKLYFRSLEPYFAEDSFANAQEDKNIDGLLKQYFGEDSTLPIIEIFDEESIHSVYEDIVNMYA